MHPPGADTVLVRHGEIGTKSEQVRRKMEGQLRDNIAAVLSDRGFEDVVECRRTRLYVETHPDRIERVTECVADAFGVVSASPTVRTEPTLSAICDALADAADAQYDGGTFAVDARRAGQPEDHPFSSGDIESDGGATIWEAATRKGVDPEVDLDDPDLTFSVECRPEDAYVFLEKRDGPGGLPVGTQRPLVVLLSGGIDSPVAAWEAMRRGCPVYPLYFDLGEYGGPDHRARAEATVETLRRYAPNQDVRLRVADAGEAVDRIVAETEALRMLVLRRFMLRVAQRLAEELDAVGLVTGEAIGQKSSQTSANLAVTDAATDLPVHRPLVTMDKTAITERARRIGTFDDATVPTGCDRIAPPLPETAASLGAVRTAEPADLETLVERTSETVSVVGSADSLA